tara:strand:- start:505 stop:756 length:252 start_codon:yes stop_codon:yes gene_type:complete
MEFYGMYLTLQYWFGCSCASVKDMPQPKNKISNCHYESQKPCEQLVRSNARDECGNTDYNQNSNRSVIRFGATNLNFFSTDDG